jgi:predicted N-acetyltransferase YhbS
MFVLDSMTAVDGPAVERLLDRAFGPDRRAKTAERLREGRAPAEGLAFVARERRPRGRGRVIGALTFWDVACGEVPALMLGPLAVDAEARSRGLGSALVRRGLEAAAARGDRAVILVGDAPYYARFGFTRDVTRSLVLPGPVDRARFLGLELAPGALAGASGIVRPSGRFAEGVRRAA